MTTMNNATAIQDWSSVPREFIEAFGDKAVIEPQLHPSHSRYPIAEERDCHVPSFLIIHATTTSSHLAPEGIDL